MPPPATPTSSIVSAGPTVPPCSGVVLVVCGPPGEATEPGRGVACGASARPTTMMMMADGIGCVLGYLHWSYMGDFAGFMWWRGCAVAYFAQIHFLSALSSCGSHGAHGNTNIHTFTIFMSLYLIH